MGIDYEFHLLVADLSWRPSAAAAQRVVDVLIEYFLIRTDPRILTPTGPRRRLEPAANQDLRSDAALPDNCVLAWPTDDTLATAVTHVFGPNEADSGIGPDERYLDGIALTLGSDFRLVSAMTYEQYDTWPDDEDGWDGDVFPASFDDPVPAVEFQVCAAPPPVPPDFTGLWRSGIRFDLGRDQPAFLQSTSRLPCREFVAAISSAFGTSLAEIGWAY